MSDFTLVQWCSGCDAEQAETEIEIYLGEQWITINVGKNCLTRLAAEGKIEL